MALTQNMYGFDECEVTTVANTKATIPPGRHPVAEFTTGIGGVSIRPVGVAIDIDTREWVRIVEAGYVHL